MSWCRIWSKPWMLSSMESTGTRRDHYEEDAMFGVEVYYGQSGTWAMRLNLKLLLLVISICNFASFILHLHRFDFKRPKRTTSFPGCVCIKKQRGWVSAGFVRVARVLPGQLLGEFLLRLGPVPGPGRPGAGSTRRASPDFKTMIPSQYLPLSITLTQLHALSANVVQSMTTTRNLHLLWRFLQISPDGIQHPIRFSMM
jgi:hypothetical protein